MTITQLGPRGLPLWVKDPGANKEYGFDWSLRFPDDDLVSCVWSVPSGLTKGAAVTTSTVTTVELAGGTHGQLYKCTAHVVTESGREDDASLEILVKES